MRIHNIGILPWNEASKIPTMSHWIHDVMPFYPCCMWQDEQSSGCQSYRFERRASQDCVGYQPPGGATVFGDPHIYTFDNMAYTFNGLGEFVLVRSDSAKAKLDIQGRFEQVGDSPYGTVDASMLTAVAAKDNFSSTVEVRMRPRWAQWRYKLDVIVDGRLIYFDRYPQKIQHFPGVTVYTPTNILNQSHVVVMFQSGAGVEVMENMHYMATRVYLPWEFINQTRGLFGNWTFDQKDDFTLPDGHTMNMNINPDTPETNMNLQQIHDNFGMEWLVHDKENVGLGKSLFFHDNGRSSNFYSQKNFKPEFDILPEIPENVTWVDADLVEDMCGESYQCRYDYSTTLNKEFAVFTKYYQDQFINIYEGVIKPEARVISCGQLPTPGNGRKSTFAFTPGTMVKFDCDPGYVLVGERRRWCYMSGDWNWPEKGDAQCMPADQYNTMRAGIVSGIVLAVLVPLACIIFCICQKIRGGDDGGDGGGGGRQQRVRDYNMDKPIVKKDPMKNDSASYRTTSSNNSKKEAWSDIGVETLPPTAPKRYEDAVQRNATGSGRNTEDVITKYNQSPSTNNGRNPGLPIPTRGLSSSSEDRNPGRSTSSGGRDPGMSSSSGDDIPVTSPPGGLRRWTPGASGELGGHLEKVARQMSTSSEEDQAGRNSVRVRPRRQINQNDEDSSDVPGDQSLDYSGTYLTKEPLVNRPPVVFEEKPMDVDIDIKNYRY